VVANVSLGTPADRAGLRERDVITGIDGQAVPDATALLRILSGKKPGDRVRVTVVRGRDTGNIDVVLGERPQR
jgi:serine protease DegQ